MRLAIVEPIGIDKAKCHELAETILKNKIEVSYYNSPADYKEKIKRSQGAQAVMIANNPYKDNILSQCPELKMISVAFTGVDHVGMEYCRKNKIVVSNCSGYANEAVSELVIGMCISLYRNIAASNEAVRNGKTNENFLGSELAGKKFGVIGAGAIGLKTAALAKAFGCEVYCYRRHLSGKSDYMFVDMDTILKTCDIISLHTPLNEETRGLIDVNKIKLMKKNAILINTARGPVVDAHALAQALKEHRIAGAGIDVFDTEPPLAKDEPLLNVPNVILTPHIGFNTREAIEKRAVTAFTNVAKWLEGMPQNVM
ncbi:NAD(P)-dependent oxidoreductase [Pectinatus sottacetonis]|uniref:NAD(P)-dependent oxidoreductase n=1 Tax=Pectinatus sottacetonis TaxID=1002795 RepID=UPI0018C57288|nr:NAD(P)-dependent oxidoreductase [Pectinatus sottacetonis]